MSHLLPSAAEWSALWLSTKVGIAAVLLGMGPGIACAWLLARRSFPGKTLLDVVVHLPLVIPPVAVGYLLLLLLGRRGAVGRWMEETLRLELAFTWQGAAIASGVMGFPLLVRAMRLSIEAVDRRLEEAASTLGASPARVFFTITLASAWPGLLTGSLLCFARSLGEFGATITFAGNIEGETRTVPVAIFAAMQRPDGDAAALRLVIISILIALAALFASELFARRIRNEAHTFRQAVS